MASSFITQLESSKHVKLREALVEQGFDLLPLNHAKFCAKKEGISCTLYESGKLMVQGKKSGEWIDFFLEPEILGRLERAINSAWHHGFVTHMGSDEAGKGDLFGPLCLACVMVEEAHLEPLHRLGVKDSKAIPDSKIREMALGIWKLCPCEVKVLSPPVYNKLWAKFKNLNRLMAWMHATLIYDLWQREKQRNPHHALVDQFCIRSGIPQRVATLGSPLEVQERVRAESDPAVAAASILARASFLKGIQMSSETLGLTVPKGSGAPAKAFLTQLVRQRPSIDLDQVCKTHFKTVKEVLEG